MNNHAQKHVLYDASRERRSRALDLYEGGLRVERNTRYLVRHPMESQKQYDIRRERATYRNFAAPIVDVFGSCVCEGRPERELPQVLQGMSADVDRLGSDSRTFFDDMVRMSAAGGARFVLVDFEPSLGGTVREDKNAGRRMMPYFVSVHPDDVWDWRVDRNGLEWVVIHSAEEAPRKPFFAPESFEILTVWTRSGWARYRGDTQKSMELESSGEHPCGVVPLVPFLFEPTSPMTGNAVTDDVLSLILGVYRRYSELDKMLFDCAVPLGIVCGLGREDWSNFERSSSSVLMSSEPGQITGTYMEPSGASFNSQISMLQSDIQQIREIALRMVRPDSAVGESAESKRLDNRQLETQLAKFARRCAAAEKQCWTLAARWLGMEPGPDEMQTPYNEDYSDADTNRLDRPFVLELARLQMISKATALNMLKSIGTLPQDFDVEEEMVKVAQGLMANAGPGTGGSLLSQLGVKI